MKHTCSAENRTPVIKTIGMLAKLFGSKVVLLPEIAESIVNYIWMDSRKIESGDLFVALKGETIDGHDYVETALKAGAIGALVDEKEIGRYSEQVKARLIPVADPLIALQNGAREYRQMLNIPFVAITGSNGKTTTAHFMKEILSVGFTVGTTHGNFNNHIGLPLSILRMDGMEDIAVIEMGANHVGEIGELCAIAEPDMGVITNIGYAHVGEFGGVENTAKAKFQLAEAIQKIDGLLFLNGDDRISVETNMKREIPAFYFGSRDHNSELATNVVCSSEGCYSFDFNKVRYELQMAGKHFMYSLLPALAIATRLNIKTDELQEKVKSIRPANMRGTIREINGVRYIEDCYNANPSSMKTAAELLRDIPSAGKRIAVSGDMRELGIYTEDLHRECGAYFAELKTDMVIAVGDYASFVVEGALSAGMHETQVIFCKTVAESAQTIKNVAAAGDLVLLKGSRGIGLDKVFPILEGAGL